VKLPNGWQSDFKHSDAIPRALSYSASKELAKSPAHVLAYWKKAFEPTKQMRIGKYYHKLALLNDRPEKWLKGEFEVAEAMCEVLAKHELASAMIKQGAIEKTGYCKDPDFGFDCIVKPDILLPQYGTIVDLKSAADVSLRAFRRAIYFFKYHLQAAFYLRYANVIEPNTYHTFHIIAQETKPPYGIMVYKLSEVTLTNGEMELMPLLKLFKGCLDSGEWPLYPETIIEI